jgi:hypothetical protein
VYVPKLEMVPTVEFPPRAPLTNQLTAVLLVPATVALNCCDCPNRTLVLTGDIDTATVGADAIETVALADAELLTDDCAVTRTEVDGTVDGA